MKSLIDRILEETRYAENPYFEALRRREFTHADFVETQIQFYFAVIFFPRPMAALAARIPTHELRVEVLRNVWEEHGEGNVTLTHATTFREFLSRLARLDAEEIERRALWPEVRIFNTTLAGACVLDDYLISCAMMGMIERMFCEISSWIGHGVVDNGWLSAERMIHYDLHAKLDVRHSDDFFAVLRSTWDTGRREERYAIEQGLRLGATVFNGLYEGLHRARTRRLFCEASAPRSRA